MNQLYTQITVFLMTISFLSCRGLGPLGPDLVRRYTSARFGSHSTGSLLTEEESRLLTGNCHLMLFNNVSKNKSYYFTVFPLNSVST